jgi:hypothetical protein
MVMTHDKAGRGARWFFIAVFLFLVIYYHDVVWQILKAFYQLAIEPYIPR